MREGAGRTRDGGNMTGINTDGESRSKDRSVSR